MTIRQRLRRIQPGWLRAIRRSLHTYMLLNRTMGHFRTMRSERCTDHTGEPIPWLTYSAIEFLNQLDFSGCSVFEYGSGASTLFWARRAKTVVSVEDNADWYHTMKSRLPSNVQYHLATSAQEFVGAIDSSPMEFEVIVVDGYAYRFECAKAAARKLHRHGFIILDNSDWLAKTCKCLREADLIQVDMFGLGPINGYTWTTSFFFSRQVKLTSRHDRQPVPGPGSAPVPLGGLE